MWFLWNTLLIRTKFGQGTEITLILKGYVNQFLQIFVIQIKSNFASRLWAFCYDQRNRPRFDQRARAGCWRLGQAATDLEFVEDLRRRKSVYQTVQTNSALHRFNAYAFIASLGWGSYIFSYTYFIYMDEYCLCNQKIIWPNVGFLMPLKNRTNFWASSFEFDTWM